jgi:iron complex outermembrane receptor protein
MGIYIDEVYQGQGYSADQPLLGLANVEILRGPQGTLFGKNTVSGAINLVTKQPTEELEGELAATYGNEGQMKGQAYVSGGLTTDLLGSIALSYDERDGFYNNTFLKKDTGDYDRTSSRGKLLWMATDALNFTLSADYTKRNSTEPAGTEASLPAFDTRAGIEAKDEIEFWGVALNTSYALDSGYDLVSITAYRDAEYRYLGDDDMTPARIQISDFDEHNKQFTQELRIQSPSDADFTWLAGLYYFDSERSTGRKAIFDEDLFGVVLPNLLPSPFGELFGEATAPYVSALSGYGTTPVQVDTKSYAAFVHGDWTLTDSLSLTFGLRYTKDEKDVDWQQIMVPNDPAVANELGANPPASIAFFAGIPPLARFVDFAQYPGAPFGAVNLDYKDDRDEDDWSPMAALNYQLTDETLIYGRYSGAAKSGGYNAEFMLNGLDNFEYDKETVDAYELGLKTTSFEDTLRVNLALFRMEFDDYQVFQFLLLPSGATSLELTNAGQVTVDGVEGEVTWVPTPNLRFVANGTWLDAAYDEFENPGGGAAFDGNDLPYAPELKYFLGAQYLWEMQYGTVTFDVDYTYVDKQYATPDNLPTSEIDDYNLVNARIAYAPSQGDWELAIWGRNLGDEEYNKVRNLNFLGTPRTMWGDPRLYGVTFTYFLGQ